MVGAEVLGWAVVLITMLLVAVGLVATGRGYRMVAVASGSMYPTYQVGDAVLIEMSPKDLKPGDPIVFNHPRSTGRELHRMVAVREVGGRSYYVTKGDANESIDPDLTPADAVYGRAGLRIPMIGQYLHKASLAPLRMLLLVVLAAFVLQELVILARLRRR